MLINDLICLMYCMSALCLHNAVMDMWNDATTDNAFSFLALYYVKPIRRGLHRKDAFWFIVAKHARQWWEVKEPVLLTVINDALDDVSDVSAYTLDYQNHLHIKYVENVLKIVSNRIKARDYKGFCRKYTFMYSTYKWVSGQIFT